MKRLTCSILAVSTLLGTSASCLGETDAERVLNKVRDRVVALRVFGDKAPMADFPQGAPPIWGTGFVIGPLGTNVMDRQRIVTAGHVVQKDAMWAKRGKSPVRTVFPWVLGQAGRVQVEGFRGVTVHDSRDIAQVVGPRGMTPILVQPAPMTADARYFVVSWGLDDNWGQPTEEPYVKEIRLANPAAGDPPLEDGSVLVEIVPGQQFARFKQSESGSPVIDINGFVVAIMIKERVDPATDVSTRGVALPFAVVQTWLDGIEQKAMLEPTKVTISNIGDPNTRSDYLASLPGACVFLGKHSARFVEPGSDRALADAPAGIALLRRVAGLFPETAPDRVTDENADLARALPEPEFLAIAPNGAVNVRAHCPNVVAKPRRKENWERIAYYGTILATADSRLRIRVRQVQRQAYLQDFFYWGLIESVTDNTR